MLGKLLPATNADDMQRHMSALVESAEDAIWTETLDGFVTSWNPSAEALLGYRAADIIDQPAALLIPRECEARESIIIDRIRSGKRVANFETLRRRRNGSLVDVSLTISPLRDHTRAVVGASIIMRDISEQKETVKELQRLNSELAAQVRTRTCELKEREALLQEIHHRVKNNLQVISSLINMQIRSIADPAACAALRQCQSRVATMWQIHEMLYQAKDFARVPFAQYARDLAGRVLTASGLAPNTVTLQFTLDDLSVAVDKAIPCGLILHELLSNALKHAFPDGRCGILGVELRQLEDDRVRLCVNDTGVGIAAHVEPARSESLGMQLVAALVKQLDGCLQIDRESGTSFRITFPMGTRA